MLVKRGVGAGSGSGSGPGPRSVFFSKNAVSGLSFFLKNAVLGLGLTPTLTLKQHSLKKKIDHGGALNPAFY